MFRDGIEQFGLFQKDLLGKTQRHDFRIDILEEILRLGVRVAAFIEHTLKQIGIWNEANEIPALRPGVCHLAILPGQQLRFEVTDSRGIRGQRLPVQIPCMQFVRDIEQGSGAVHHRRLAQRGAALRLGNIMQQDAVTSNGLQTNLFASQMRRKNQQTHRIRLNPVERDLLRERRRFDPGHEFHEVVALPMVLLQPLQTNLREGNILQNTAKHLPREWLRIQSLPTQLRRAQRLGDIFQHKSVALDGRLAHLRGQHLVGNKR